MNLETGSTAGRARPRQPLTPNPPRNTSSEPLRFGTRCCSGDPSPRCWTASEALSSCATSSGDQWGHPRPCLHDLPHRALATTTGGIWPEVRQARWRPRLVDIRSVAQGVGASLGRARTHPDMLLGLSGADASRPFTISRDCSLSEFLISSPTPFGWSSKDSSRRPGCPVTIH